MQRFYNNQGSLLDFIGKDNLQNKSLREICRLISGGTKIIIQGETYRVSRWYERYGQVYLSLSKWDNTSKVRSIKVERLLGKDVNFFNTIL